MYLDANNLHGRWISQKLSKSSKFDKNFIKNYDGNSNERYILEVDVEYPKKLFNLHRDLPFLAERKKVLKWKKLVFNIHDKESYAVHIRALKQALNHGLILKKVYKVIQFNQKSMVKTMHWHEYWIKNRSKK